MSAKDILQIIRKRYAPTNTGIMSKQVETIHDAFFKKVLGDPMLAGTFLREHLPPDVAGLLGPEPLEPVPASFVDEELRQHHSDLLFRAQLEGGRDAFAYILMEHKSSPDPVARLQLLRYVVRVLVRSYEQNGRQLPLPAVLSLLVHQGPEGWTPSCEFVDLFGPVSESLRPYLPSFRHALVDLAPMDDQALSGDVRLRAFLLALKYRRHRDLNKHVAIILADADALDDADISGILIYLEAHPRPVNNTVVHETLNRLVPERKERIVGSLTQPYYEKGLAEGEAIGKARGEARVLILVLERRFGALPLSFRQRVFAADVDAIEAWVGRAFDAPDLQSVFESN